MHTENKDVAPLIELLKMAAERRSTDLPSEQFSEDRALLEMWPEACRRTGVGSRPFPPKVIELWKQSLGRAH